uniref:hypothetical protein n=1 Tax=Cedecea neteri TaxID=158822 RepID=UPI001C3F16E4
NDGDSPETFTGSVVTYKTGLEVNGIHPFQHKESNTPSPMSGKQAAMFYPHTGEKNALFPRQITVKKHR